MKACERKDETITVRCTAEEKADLKEMAGKRGESVGRFLLDAGMAGRERSREKDRRQDNCLTTYCNGVFFIGCFKIFVCCV